MDRSLAMESRRQIMLRFKEGGLGCSGNTSLEVFGAELPSSMWNDQASAQWATTADPVPPKRGGLRENEVTAGLIWLRALSIPYKLTAVGSIHRSYKGVCGAWKKIASPRNKAVTMHTLRTALKDSSLLNPKEENRHWQKYWLLSWMKNLAGDDGSRTSAGEAMGNIEDYLVREVEYFDTLYQQYIKYVFSWIYDPQLEDPVTSVCRQLERLSQHKGRASHSAESGGATPSPRRCRKKPKKPEAESEHGRNPKYLQTLDRTLSAVNGLACPISKEKPDVGLAESDKITSDGLSGRTCDGTRSNKQPGRCDCGLLQMVQEGAGQREVEAAAQQKRLQSELADALARQKQLQDQLRDKAAQQEKLQKELDDAHAEQKKNMAILGRIILKKVADVKALSEQLEAEVEKSMCEICCARPRCEVILPCMHFLFCGDCLKEYRLGSDKCPTCRGTIGGSMNLKFV